MPRLKTIKAISKRLKPTGGKNNKKKFMFVPAGQDHFRSRHSGASKMKKRGYTVADKTLKRTIRRAVPHV
ncbi:MAG: hypothetical protein A3F54_05480 [Candidatus Kerfeldbacteria bacterium RIFCSPHIGHO2_12_FULL_48_17]|uniref:50S ribosomal protein L35 n=1 Tax=Candidatus Kerfeldbacteria bacterium RIFCSPHIGHO2_12_FULL_48_17 TaxID=1798542 RepID=A0A1G2B8E5_9BACT|nr:MAG: hypothetical protein A3F54_05480 [Candidatus Kerfeldbacteria bacterium RIFCSPHIGHO2_12_FULL_48_17]